MKRKKPRIFLTPELKAYYRGQYPSMRSYMLSVGKKRTMSQTFRMVPYMDRLEKLECLHPLIGYFMALNAKPGDADDVTSLCVALSKPLLYELKSTISALADTLCNEHLQVVVTSYDTQRNGNIPYEVPDEVREKLVATVPEQDNMRELDWIFDRTRYFNVEHVDIRVVTRDAPGEDAFMRSARIDAALERVVQIVEFVGESVDMMITQPQIQHE